MTEHVDLTAMIVDVMGLQALPIMHGHTLKPYLQGRSAVPRDHIFSEYLDNEEAYIRTNRWKFMYCTGKRARTDGYLTANPTPGRYRILYDLAADPGEFSLTFAIREGTEGKSLLFNEALKKVGTTAGGLAGKTGWI